MNPSILALTWLCRQVVIGNMLENWSSTKENLVSIAKHMELNTRVTSLNDPSTGNFMGAPRSGIEWTWRENYELVRSKGHKWCGLVRDNWSCLGLVYKDVLSHTPPYDSQYSLGALPIRAPDITYIIILKIAFCSRSWMETLVSRCDNHLFANP